jgi:hypothetical protein
MTEGQVSLRGVQLGSEGLAESDKMISNISQATYREVRSSSDGSISTDFSVRDRRRLGCGRINSAPSQQSQGVEFHSCPHRFP